MDDQAGTSFARLEVKSVEACQLKHLSGNDLLRPERGHPEAPRGAKLGASYNRFVHTYCAAILVSRVQWGGSNA